MANDSPQLTTQTLKVLVTLMQDPRDELSGAQIRKCTGLHTGTLYPILLRLERASWLESRWEVEDPQSLGRPRRRYYRVTALGAQQARAAVQEIKAVVGELSWA
jgi:DNA-binding PadR family transcriptional regulator